MRKDGLIICKILIICFIKRVSSDDFVEEESHLNSNRDPFPRCLFSLYLM